MAGCFGCSEKGNVSLKDVKTWTMNLSNVLTSSTARDRFKSYLTDREFEEGQSLVKFWEMCDRFMNWRKENLELDAHCTKTGAADGGDRSEKLVLEEAEQIVQFAEDNIAFDAQMINLKAALHSGDTDKIETVILKAQRSAAEMLDKYYKAFCQYLLQEKGLLRNGD